VLKRMGDDRRADSVESLAGQIEQDFQRYLMPDGVVAGFAVFDSSARPIEYLLHPSDSRTGLHYRLIPMTRGILSGIFSPGQAQRHLGLIQEHLLFPDGARLMDRPTTYSGGLERTFRRSESAAFFGREVGLQYVHAHLRYAEAMAKLGRADDLWHALRIVNPIVVTELLANARPRQRNCYFSSSDAAFATRAEASQRYSDLRRGEVPVDGGWRIYSSGPGIYTNLVVRHLFGLRQHFASLEFDPVLPRELDGLTVEMTRDSQQIAYHFRVPEQNSSPREVRVNGTAIPLTDRATNPYRSGGIRIPKSAFEKLLVRGPNTVQILL
jgi:1,2-beta-oligoglucan phosphorylase